MYIAYYELLERAFILINKKDCMIRKIVVGLIVMLTFSFISTAFADQSSSKVLLDKLYDIRHLVKSGVNFEDYSKNVTELSLAYGRFERDKQGKEFSTNEMGMRSATEHYLEARKIWLEGLSNQMSVERKDLNKQLLQIKWDQANIEFGWIEAGKKSKKKQK